MSEPAAKPAASAEAPSQAEEEPLGPTSAGELYGSRGTRAPHAWLWIALPVTGLMIVPVVGLVYAATSSFGRDEPVGSSEPTGLVDDPDGAGKRLAAPPTAKTAAKRKPARTAKTSDKPRLASAAVCCTKLHQLGKTGEMDDRGTFIAAAAVCDAAVDDEEKAFTQVGKAIRTARVQVPEECQP